MDLLVKRFDKNFPLPTTDDNAACFDFACRKTVVIPPYGVKAVPLNLAVKVPQGYALLLFSRSSTPIRSGLILANGVGVVDPFFCGDKDENVAFFLNITDQPVTVEAGDKIVQGMMIKIEPVNWREVETMLDPGLGGYHNIEELL